MKEQHQFLDARDNAHNPIRDSENNRHQYRNKQKTSKSSEQVRLRVVERIPQGWSIQDQDITSASGMKLNIAYQTTNLNYLSSRSSWKYE